MISSVNPASVALNYTIEGQTVSILFGDLDSALHDTIRRTFVQGLAIGSGVVLLLISWLLVANKKTPMFVLHQTCLLLLVIRLAFYLAYLLGPLNSYLYAYTSLFYNYWSAFRLAIATNVFYILLIAAIECTMALQVYVIFKSAKSSRWSWYLLSVSGALGLTVVVLYMISITNYLISMKEAVEVGYSEYASWQNNVPFILFSVSINFTCVLLILKLFIAVRTRRVLGLRQFGTMHILLIMSTQTCIIPSIMTIYNYLRGDESPEYVNLSLVLIVCNLPFSSLWASTANNSLSPQSFHPGLFSRTVSGASSERTVMLSPGVQKVSTLNSDYEKGTVVSTFHDAENSDVDSIERVLNEVERENAYGL